MNFREQLNKPNKQTNKQMLPRTPAGQERLAFEATMGSAVAAAAGATVDEDDQDDEAVRMISREDLDGEYYDCVFGGKDSDSDMDISDYNM